MALDYFYSAEDDLHAAHPYSLHMMTRYFMRDFSFYSPVNRNIDPLTGAQAQISGELENFVVTHYEQLMRHQAKGTVIAVLVHDKKENVRETGTLGRIRSFFRHGSLRPHNYAVLETKAIVDYYVVT